MTARGRFENLAGDSTGKRVVVAERAAVEAPTAIADETHAGKAIAVSKSSLPLAMTVATPALRNISIDVLMA